MKRESVEAGTLHAYSVYLTHLLTYSNSIVLVSNFPLPPPKICLFGGGWVRGTSHTRIFFHSYGDVTNICEGLQILSFFRHSWPLSSEFFSMPHLLSQGASVYNGHLRGPVTFTPVAERLAVELSLRQYGRK